MLILLGCILGGKSADLDSSHPRRDDTSGADSADTSDTFDTSPADTGLNPDDPLCKQSFSEATPAGPDCVTASIACGQTVEAGLVGGLSEWSGTDYTHAFCFPNLDEHDYSAPERVYALDLPAHTPATVSLHSPCADADLAVLRWEQTDHCPEYDDAASTCEGSDAAGDDSVSVSWDQETRWLIIVDAKDAGDANFRLEVSCD